MPDFIKVDIENAIKESTIEKLVSISEKESENEMKTKLNDTIEKIKTESFDLMNYIRLKQLKDSIHQES